ncbi:hypothetical protein [Prosthecobacter sp.]|uniref:hypothetical protein n=1 Tax=Prosthecobacter sp. TaxID=1965333 RepID=UPI003784AEE2
MSRLFEKRNRDGTAPSSRGIPQSGGLGFDDLVYRGQAPGAGNGGAGSFTNADAMPGVRLQQLAAAAGSQEQQVRGAAVHAQGGRLGAQQAAAPKSSIPSTPPNPTSAAEKRSFSSPRRVSGDRPLGYKKPKPQPPKEPALIQNDKVIQASSVSPSKRGLAVLREFFNPDATDLNQLYDSMRKRLADGEALVLLINSNGAHAAIITFYLDEEGNLVSTLFDPGGEYKHGGVRGSDGVFTNTIPKQGPNETRWSLAEYIEFHSKDGAMSFVPVWTDAKTAQDFQYPQGTSGGFCAKASCAVLVQIPGITHRGGPGPFFPSALSDRLYKLMGRRVTIKH